jgi:hypothetical protein
VFGAVGTASGAVLAQLVHQLLPNQPCPTDHNDLHDVSLHPNGPGHPHRDATDRSVTRPRFAYQCPRSSPAAVKCRSAAPSLREGLDETLTVLRLGVPPTLARTLRSTNAIESMISICRDHSANVKRWRDGQMALRRGGVRSSWHPTGHRADAAGLVPPAWSRLASSSAA